MTTGLSEATDLTEPLRAAVARAFAMRTPLSLRGGGSKAFLCPPAPGEPLDVSGHRGVIDYEPTELVVTVRAGTALVDLESALTEQGQCLPFEPPHFGARATVGGTLACGLSGPRRPYSGAARDAVLGVTCVNGRGERLVFGGRVMKNVAGYDLSRLMVGARGTLGVLLDVSMKVLPRPERVLTLAFECSAAHAIERMNQWAGQPLPLSATAHDGARLYVRLSGADAGVAAARGVLGGEPLDDVTDFWAAVREHTHPFFRVAAPVWRVSLPPATPPLEGDVFMEWNGGLRWWRTNATPDAVHAAARAAGGHALPFRGFGATPPASALNPVRASLEARLRVAFDPERVLNRFV